MRSALPATIPIMPMPIFIIMPAPAIIIISIVFASFFPLPLPGEIFVLVKHIFIYVWCVPSKRSVGSWYWNFLVVASVKILLHIMSLSFWLFSSKLLGSVAVKSSSLPARYINRNVFKQKFKPLTYFVFLNRWRVWIAGNGKIVCDGDCVRSFNQPVQKVDSFHFETDRDFILTHAFLESITN